MTRTRLGPSTGGDPGTQHWRPTPWNQHCCGGTSDGDTALEAENPGDQASGVSGTKHRVMERLWSRSQEQHTAVQGAGEVLNNLTSFENA